jgi:RNA polymerase sigma-B factor
VTTVAPLTGLEEPSVRQRARAVFAAYHRSRDREALDAVVSAYQGLAFSLAGRFARSGEDIDDLNQVALIGLLKAIERYDPGRGVQLTTFATATILGELKRHLRDRAWCVRPPRRVHDLYIRAQQGIDELTQSLGRSPTVREVARHVDAGEDEIAEALWAGGLRASSPLSPIPGDEEGRGNTSAFALDENLAEVEGRLMLIPLLARLPERERLVVELRFVAGWPQSQIGAFVGATQMQVSRMLTRSLAQLRSWTSD